MCDNDYINSIRNEIRGYMVMRGQTYKTVAEKLSERFGENVSAQSLNNKLARGSLRYIDAKNIAEVLGYKIKWE
ncbi:LLM class flavin-dependent oxidoreductase [bacterium]|nr:LLM class flavin-dependent oxidoreductase [bacterium]